MGSSLFFKGETRSTGRMGWSFWAQSRSWSWRVLCRGLGRRPALNAELSRRQERCRGTQHLFCRLFCLWQCSVSFASQPSCPSRTSNKVIVFLLNPYDWLSTNMLTVSEITMRNLLTVCCVQQQEARAVLPQLGCLLVCSSLQRCQLAGGRLPARVLAKYPAPGFRDPWAARVSKCSYYRCNDRKLLGRGTALQSSLGAALPAAWQSSTWKVAEQLLTSGQCWGWSWVLLLRLCRHLWCFSLRWAEHCC